MNESITDNDPIINLSEWCDFCEYAAVYLRNDPCRGCYVDHRVKQHKNPNVSIQPKDWVLHSDHERVKVLLQVKGGV